MLIQLGDSHKEKRDLKMISADFKLKSADLDGAHSVYYTHNL